MGHLTMTVRFTVRCTSDGFCFSLYDEAGKETETSGAIWESSAAAERAARFIMRYRQEQEAAHA